MTTSPAIRIALTPLPAVDPEHGPVARRQAWKQAAASHTRRHLETFLPELDLATMRRGRHGKPLLPPPFEHWGFNPSDSGGWLLFGLVEGAQIGVDLELRAPRANAMAIAQRHFPADEVDWLREQADLDHAFLRLWTMKEALFKAIGRGLGYGLSKARFLPGADGRLRLDHLAGDAGPAADWSSTELELGDGHVGAAVWSGAPRIVQHHRDD